VRVTDSGTGCGESWPLCQGGLLPRLEYHQLVEWNHRLFATLVGLLMVVTVGSTLLWYRKSRKLAVLAVLAAATYLSQAILGGITVLLHLDRTWVAAHMGNSMILLASVTLLALFARITEYRVPPLRSSVVGRRSSVVMTRYSVLGTRYLAIATLVATYAAMLTGSAVVGDGADLACPSWPQCSAANLLPTTYDAWINFGHRLAVGMSDVLMLVLTLAVWRFYRGQRRLRITAHLLALLYVSQVFLGAFTVWLAAPEALRGAHLALAAATWSALVVLATLLWVGQGSDDGRRTKNESILHRQDAKVRQARQGIYGFESQRAQSTEGAKRPFKFTYYVLRFTFYIPTIRLYLSLIKPRVIPLLLVPTVAAMLMAAVQHSPSRSLPLLILFTMLGGTLATAGAHSINQYLDRDIDAKMRRTRQRPVVTHRIPPHHALIMGIVLTIAAFLQLWLTVNVAAALLALAGNLFYVFVYTLWLKRTSVQNIVIGGAAGAVPPLVGWAAVTGGVDIPALLFFAIIFFWTPAHFWALALVRQEDYRMANVPMLPVVRGEAYTRASILRYSVLLLVASLLPIATRSLSWLYLAAALGLGVVFVARAVQLARGASTARAWGLFTYSNIYLALLYAAMVLDRVIALSWTHL
jgi:protoheme IX farnesyltransferase